MANSEFGNAVLLFLVLYWSFNSSANGQLTEFPFVADGTTQTICPLLPSSFPSQFLKIIPSSTSPAGNFSFQNDPEFTFMNDGDAFTFRATTNPQQLSKGEFSLIFTEKESARNTSLSVQYAPSGIYPNADHFDVGTDFISVAQIYNTQSSVLVCDANSMMPLTMFRATVIPDSSCVIGNRGIVRVMSVEDITVAQDYQVVLAIGTCVSVLQSDIFTLTSVVATSPPPPTTETEGTTEIATPKPINSTGLIVGVVVAVVVIIAGVIFVVSLILFRYRTKLLKCWCSEDGQVSAVSILRNNGNHPDGPASDPIGNGHINRRRQKYSHISFVTPTETDTKHYKDLTESLASCHQLQEEPFIPDGTINDNNQYALQLFNKLRSRREDHLVYIIWDGKLESLNGHGSHISSLFEEIQSRGVTLHNLLLVQLGNGATEPLQRQDGLTIYPVLNSPKDSNFSGKVCGEQIYSIVSRDIELCVVVEEEVVQMAPPAALQAGDAERGSSRSSSLERHDGQGAPSASWELAKTKNTTSVENSPLTAHDPDALKKLIKEGVQEGVGNLLRNTENNIIGAVDSSIKGTVADSESRVKETVADSESRVKETVTTEAEGLHKRHDDLEEDVEDIGNATNKNLNIQKTDDNHST